MRSIKGPHRILCPSTQSLVHTVTSCSAGMLDTPNPKGRTQPAPTTSEDWNMWRFQQPHPRQRFPGVIPPPACATLRADQTLSRPNTGLATTVGDGPDPQCGAQGGDGTLSCSPSHCRVLFRDVHPRSFISASPEKAPVL